MLESTPNQIKNRSPKGSLTHRFQFYLFSSISFLIFLLPRKTMVKVGRGFGGLGFLLWKERRKIALSNLDLAFGDTKTQEEKSWIAKEAFKNIGATTMELGWGLRRMNEKVFFEVVEVEGLEIIRSALSRRKGAIILAAHYGNWEIMANACGYVNINAHYVAKRLKNPFLDRAVNEYRCETGNKVIYLGLLPWFHSFGQIVIMLGACASGNRLICIPDPRAGTPPFTEVLRSIHRHEAYQRVYSTPLSVFAFLPPLFEYTEYFSATSVA